jgi:hypothetical protein
MAYMSADELRARVPALADPSIEDEWLEEYVAEFEEIAERYIGLAYEERTETEVFDLNRTGAVLLKWGAVSSIDAIDIDGYDVETTAYTYTDGYSIRFIGLRTGLLTVEYTHGLSEPPVALLRACREFVRASALSERSRVPRDAYASDVEGITYRLSTPDWDNGRPTGFIPVDEVLDRILKTDGFRTPGVA